MRVKRIHNRIVVECQHCLGTTQCQYTVHFNSKRDTYEIEHWLACPGCGEGCHVTEHLKRFNDPSVLDPSVLHRPLCSVCDGRGFIIT